MPSPDINQTVTGVMTWVSKNTRTGALGSGSLGSHLIYYQRRNTSSVRTPGFRTMKPADYPINPYSYDTDNIDDPRSSFVTYSQPVTGGDIVQWTYSMNAISFGARQTPTAAETADDPSQQVIKKIQDQLAEGKSNLAVTMLEMNKTAALVASTATRLAGALRALKSGRFGDFTTALGVTASSQQRSRYYSGLRKAVYQDYRYDHFGESASRRGTRETFKYRKHFDHYKDQYGSRTSSFAADTWLEYSYGWKPLLKDVYDTAQAAAAVMSQHRGITRYVKASATNQKRTNSKVIPVGNQVIYETYASSTVGVAMGIWYGTPSGAVSYANAFGLTNPLLVAWELVPFSFVVDWFYPVGNALQSLTAYDGLVFSSGWKAFKHERIFQSKVYGKGESVIGSTRWFGQAGGAQLERYEFDNGRSVLGSFPSYGFPNFKDPRSFAHAASAIALLQSLFLQKNSNLRQYLR